MAAEELEQDGSLFKALSHARRRSSLGGLNLFTSLFLLEQVNERIFAAVFELSGIKIPDLVLTMARSSISLGSFSSGMSHVSFWNRTAH
jgi:hypothetical protein